VAGKVTVGLASSGHESDVSGFYPREVYVSAVFATATWLAGCLSHASIVTKRLNLS